LLRGLHYQRVNPQGKTGARRARRSLRCGRRYPQRFSPISGAWFGTRLDDELHRQLWIPPGFAHGFCVLSADADFAYKCTQYYDAGSDDGIRWDDPDLGIDWPVFDDIAPQLSDKDRVHQRLAEHVPDSLPRCRSVS